MRTTRGFALSLAAMAGAMAVSFLAAGSLAQAQDKLPINVGAFQNPNLNIWAPVVAGELGLYAKHGLDAHVEITRPANLMPMLLSGDLDVMCTGGPFFQALLQGQELELVMGEGPNLPYTLVARSEFKDIASLRGKILSTPQVGAGTSYLVIVETLKKAGIAENEVQWVELPDAPTRARALISGRIDATVLTQDETLFVEGRPEVVVLDPNPGANTEVKPFMNCFTTKAYAAGHAENLKRWVAAMVEAHRTLNADRDTYISLVAKIKGDQYTPEEAGKLFDIARSSNYWSLNGGMDPKWYQVTLDYFLNARDDEKVTPKLSDFYNDSYARYALEVLGKVPSESDPADWAK